MTDAISLEPGAPPPTGKPVRYRLERDYTELVPVHVVWEVTLACNLKCQHCGSRAGRPGRTS
jgi:MoaA/NifB/PqqE/SkfB family radical SAM enzyme